MKILLLAGTGEATRLATALSAQGHHVIASLAGATRMPKGLDCETRSGGFGGDSGFVTWLLENAPDMVLDATHPFADKVSHRTARICAERNLPYVQVLRPAWVAEPDQGIHEVPDVAAVQAYLPEDARVFLATGRQTLMDFAPLQGCYLICRQIDAPQRDFPFKNGMFLVGRPPFSAPDEKALFMRLDVNVLVVKNAGGQASYSKIEAAKELGIPVLMLKRPVQPDAPKVETVEDALQWVANLADH